MTRSPIVSFHVARTSMTPDPIIFLHIPRTGGMSFRKLMHIAYGYNNIGRPWWGDHEGEDLSQTVKDKFAWYGHFKFGLHEKLGRQVKYITIIREPSSRLLSEYHRNDYRNRYGMTPLDLARTARGKNLMVRLLSGSSVGEDLTDKHVDKAVSIVKEHFSFVGRTERFNDILEHVRGLGWPVSKEPWENKGAQGTTTLDEFLELRRMPELALDYELYRRLSNDQ